MTFKDSIYSHRVLDRMHPGTLWSEETGRPGNGSSEACSTVFLFLACQAPVFLYTATCPTKRLHFPASFVVGVSRALDTGSL